MNVNIENTGMNFMITACLYRYLKFANFATADMRLMTSNFIELSFPQHIT